MAANHRSLRDTHDFVDTFLLLDRVEHERCNRFAGEIETHLRSSILSASTGCVVFLSETWSTSDRPIQIATSHDFFHGKRIAHVVSHDKTGDSIGNTRKMRRS
jgi:hypothetical protein